MSITRVLPVFVTFAVLTPVPAATIPVGPGQRYTRVCDAVAAARTGDTIEVASGNYDGDVCAFGTPGITVRGVGPTRPHLRANGRYSQGKGIFVINATAHSVVIENLEFSGAQVPDKNGAAIRVDPGPGLVVRNCHIHDNENGILAGDSQSEILVENSIFENNGSGDGLTHNIYVNHVRRFVFRGNYSARSKIGHLVKSRAAENLILYNRLTQETGTGSREIDLSNGGRSFVIGNVIQQGPSAPNKNFIGYRLEGAHESNPSEELFLINNTFVNRADSGTFVDVAPDVKTPVVVRNNIFSGPGRLINQTTAQLSGNFIGEPGYLDPANYDFSLRAGSPALNAGVDPGAGAGQSLAPLLQYLHPACLITRTAVQTIDPGAFEFGLTVTPAAGPDRCGARASTASVAVVNGASFERDKVAPGSIFAIFGENLGPGVVQASAAPWPAHLQGVSATINAQPVPIYYVSPTQINGQVPVDAEPGEGVLAIRTPGNPVPAQRILISRAAPGIFLIGERAAAQNQDYSLNGPGNGAPPGSYVIVYFTGIGTTTRYVRSGEAAPFEPLAAAAMAYRVTVGGREAEVAYLGLTPGLVGVGQATFKVPDLAPGEHPVMITIDGVASNAARITVAAGASGS